MFPLDSKESIPPHKESAILKDVRRVVMRHVLPEFRGVYGRLLRGMTVSSDETHICFSWSFLWGTGSKGVFKTASTPYFEGEDAFLNHVVRDLTKLYKGRYSNVTYFSAAQGKDGTFHEDVFIWFDVKEIFLKLKN
jgi:hypothetical protein